MGGVSVRSSAPPGGCHGAVAEPAVLLDSPSLSTFCLKPSTSRHITAAAATPPPPPPLMAHYCPGDARLPCRSGSHPHPSTVVPIDFPGQQPHAGHLHGARPRPCWCRTRSLQSRAAKHNRSGPVVRNISINQSTSTNQHRPISILTFPSSICVFYGLFIDFITDRHLVVF